MNPTAFKIGNLAIHWYGLMMAIGFLAAYIVASRYAKRVGFPQVYVADSLIAAVIGGLLGARINYLISYWDRYVEVCTNKGSSPWVRLLFVHEGGLVFLGGFFGAAATVALLGRIRGFSLMQIADMAAMGVPVGHMFGRIGCFMTGCCFGKPTDGYVSISYPIEHYRRIAQSQLQQGLIDRTAEYCHPLLPSQLFASASNLLIFVFVYLVMRSRKLKKSGQLFSMYLIIYSISRFTNAFFRGDHDGDHRYWRWLYESGLSEAQTKAPFILLIGAIWFALAERYSSNISEFLSENALNRNNSRT